MNTDFVPSEIRNFRLLVMETEVKMPEHPEVAKTPAGQVAGHTITFLRPLMKGELTKDTITRFVGEGKIFVQDVANRKIYVPQKVNEAFSNAIGKVGIKTQEGENDLSEIKFERTSSDAQFTNLYHEALEQNVEEPMNEELDERAKKTEERKPTEGTSARPINLIRKPGSKTAGKEAVENVAAGALTGEVDRTQQRRTEQEREQQRTRELREKEQIAAGEIRRDLKRVEQGRGSTAEVRNDPGDQSRVESEIRKKRKSGT